MAIPSLYLCAEELPNPNADQGFSVTSWEEDMFV